MSTVDSNTDPAGARSDTPGVIDAEATAVADVAPSWWSRAASWLGRVFADPPEIVDTAQPSLADVVAYSRSGEWSAQQSGAARSAHLAYTYLIAVPITAGAYWLRWIAARPARLAVSAVAAVVIGTGLAQVPGPGWIVPGFLDVTTWF